MQNKIINYKNLSKYDELLKNYIDNSYALKTDIDETHIARLTPEKKVITISPSEWTNKKVTKNIGIDSKFFVQIGVPQSENTDNLVEVSNACIIPIKHEGNNLTLSCLNNIPTSDITLEIIGFTYTNDLIRATELDNYALKTDLNDYALKSEVQDSLTDAQKDATNSGITSSKVSGYDSHLKNTTVHITSAERTKWNAKQDALTESQLTAISNVSNKADKATTLSEYGITDAYTKTQVDNKISGLVNSAPETLDTLKELADALGNDANFATTVATDIGKKANDSDVVHKSGNETINGTKTFNSQIKGTIDKSKDYYLSDNTLASANGSLGTVKYYPSASTADLDTEIFEHSLWGANKVANSIPSALDSFYYIDQYFYSGRTATSNRIQILRGYRNANLHMVRVYNGQTSSWSGWTKFADDSEVVKLSGDQSIAGNKTFTGTVTLSNDTDFSITETEIDTIFA